MDNKFRSWIMKHLEKKEWVYRNEDERQEMYKSAVQGGYMGSFESFSRKVRKAKNEVRGTQEPILTSVLPEKNNIYMEEEGNEGVVTSECSTQIKSIEQLLEACNVDMDKWILKSQKVNAWNAQTKEGELATLFQVKGYLEKKVPDVQRIPVVQPIVIPNPPKRIVSDRVPANRSLVIGDAQIGFNCHIDGTWETYHDVRAMDIVLQVVADNQFDNIVLLGDFLDCTEASKYTQKPEFAGTMQKSINTLGAFIYSLRELAPSSKIVFMAGNHERRLQSSMIDNLKYAYGLTAYKDDLPVMSLSKLLALDAIDVEVIEDYPSGTFWIGNNLKIIHGEFVSVSKELSSSDTHTIMGHIHRRATDSRSIFMKDGIKQISIHSIGCLCKIDGTVPGVNSRPSWQQGGAIVEHVENHVSINHFSIENGVCVLAGKKYVGKDL